MECKTIVVDASVARAAGGGNAPDGGSKNAHDTLNDIQTFGHKVAFDQVGLREWQKHNSNSARIWYSNMLSRSQVVLISSQHADAIAEMINGNAALTDDEKKLLLKDIHLIDVAFQVDRVVVSLDRKFFNCLPRAKVVQAYCAFVVWVNPKHLDEAMTEWLRNASLTGAESAQSLAIRCVT